MDAPVIYCVLTVVEVVVAVEQHPHCSWQSTIVVAVTAEHTPVDTTLLKPILPSSLILNPNALSMMSKFLSFSEISSVVIPEKHPHPLGV